MKFSRYPQADLEWLVEDSIGYIAIFTTGGSGFAPLNVDSQDELHATFMNHVPTPHWGSREIWKDYANAGLYCYDWQESTSSYVQVASPSAPLSADLIALLENHAILWQFPGPFADSPVVKERDWLAT